jgi:predicted dehydrogenase
MTGRTLAWLVAAALASAAWALQESSRSMPAVRLMMLDPGHFHAALVQKEMYPDVAARVDVFAPLGSDLVGHLNRIASFNTRQERPTAWQLEVHAGPDFVDRMLHEHPGNVVILSGRNRLKIDQIARSIHAGLSVLADKPWILKSDDLPKMEAALAEADARSLVAYDIMTERFEITTVVQRALVNDRGTFGEIVKGTEADPAVYMESVHHLMKVVAGAPNIRPAWFFDTAEQGEGFNDIGTHLVDLVQWTLFPGSSIDKGGKLEYYCNTLVSYALRGIHTTLNVIWDWEAPAGSGDIHFAAYRGTRARIEARQSRVDRFRPELYVIAADAATKPQVLAAVQARIRALERDYPGIGVEDRDAEIHITIPDRLRIDHEAHFAQVTTNFLAFLRDRRTLPPWERPNMLAKYYVTTKGTELSRQGPPRIATRRAPR